MYITLENFTNKIKLKLLTNMQKTDSRVVG